MKIIKKYYIKIKNNLLIEYPNIINLVNLMMY